MPNRIIRDSIRTSESLSRLTAEEERHFYRLLVFADDYGRFDARYEVILGACYPLAHGKIAPVDVGRWTQRLAADDIGILVLYEVDGKPYGAFRQWSKYQRTRAADSKFPVPPSSDNICPQPLSNVAVVVNVNEVGNVVGVGVGVESEDEDAAEVSDETSAGTAAPQKRRKKTTQVTEAFKAEMRERFEPVLGSTVDERIEEALAHQSARKYTDLQAHVRAWLRRDAERMQTANGRSPPTKSGGNGKKYLDEYVRRKGRLPWKDSTQDAEREPE